MDSLIYFILTLSIFWFVLNLIYSSKKDFFENKGLKLYYGFILVWKKHANIKSVGAFRKLSYASIPLSLYGLYVFYTTMILSTLSRFQIVEVTARPRLLIPGVNITGLSLLYFSLAVVIAAAFHELSHAYVARSHGIRVKSLGFAIIFFLPIAFTEIDDEAYRQASMKQKVLTLMAGPAANILLALVFLGLLFFAINPSALTIVGVMEDSLAEEYGLHENTIILEINGKPASLDELHAILLANKTMAIRLKILDENMVLRDITIIKPGNVTKLGVYLVPYAPNTALIKILGVDKAFMLISQFNWIYIVNFSLGIINIAPLFITDGGKMVYELLGKKRISLLVNGFTLIILILALAP
ncbi:MAG: peptidase M50 [Thermoprotei archaeon]|nr:MAG: peptidase M50 [Thermoprotei archaeon]